VALPFASIRGESALRFDVGTLRLHFFGATLWMGELFPLLLGTLTLLFAFLIVTLVWGRVWCGYSCPQTLLADLTRPLVLERARKRRRPLRLALAWALVAGVAALFSAATLWYFVPPQAFLARLLGGELGSVLSGSWIVLGLTLFLDLGFVRGSFCATTCPYAKFQGVLFDANTLVVAYDPRRDDECIDCLACVRVCPTGIDIRDGLQAACIHCAECVDACLPIMARRSRPTLVSYSFGEPGTARRRLRPAVVALCAATAVAAAGTVAAAVEMERASLELNAALSSQYQPRRADDGRVVNAYAVALENRGRRRLQVNLSLDAGGREAQVRPAELTLAPGEHRALTLVATVRGGRAGVGSAALVASAAGLAPLRARVALVVPEEP